MRQAWAARRRVRACGGGGGNEGSSWGSLCLPCFCWLPPFLSFSARKTSNKPTHAAMISHGGGMVDGGGGGSVTTLEPHIVRNVGSCAKDAQPPTAEPAAL